MPLAADSSRIGGSVGGVSVCGCVGKLLDLHNSNYHTQSVVKLPSTMHPIAWVSIS